MNTNIINNIKNCVFGNGWTKAVTMAGMVMVSTWAHATPLKLHITEANRKILNSADINDYFANFQESDECILGDEIQQVDEIVMMELLQKMKENHITHLTLSKNMKELPFNNPIQKAYNDLTSIDFGGIESISDSLCEHSQNLRKVTLPCVTSIGNNAFADCNSLREVEGEHVLEINRTAFANDSSLRTINFPEVEEIKLGAFINCTNLQFIYVPAIRIFHRLCFKNCQHLQTVTTGANNLSMISIGDSTFANCDSLNTFTFLQAKITNKAFWGCQNLNPIDSQKILSINPNAF